MPADLRRHQHEIVADVPGAVGVVFGTEDTKYLTLTVPSVAAGSDRDGDVESAQEDGTTFGRDYRGNKTYGFEFGVLCDDALVGLDRESDVRDALHRLEAVWHARRWRDNPRAYAVLRSYVGTRVVRCYGRPRRWSEASANLIGDGYVPVVADFALRDDRWYDDTENSTVVTLVPSSEGGFIAPLVAPVTTTYTTAAQHQMTVSGPMATWVVVTFTGPVSAPQVRIGDLVIGLSGTLAPGESVTFDPRPWQRTVLRDADGAGMGGRMSRGTPPMKNMLVEPGVHNLDYSGFDPTGTSMCRLRWRDAYPRP